MAIDIDKEREACAKDFGETWSQLQPFTKVAHFSGWLAAKRHAAEVAAPSGASVEGDALGKGCRDAFNLILNCRKLMAEKQMDKAANWVIACELFSVGSTTAMAICREADIDPRAYTMEKLAAMSPNKEG